MLRASGLFPPPLWGREFCFSLPPVGEGVLFFPPPCGGGSFVFPSPLWGREFCFSLPLVGEGVLFFPPPCGGGCFVFPSPLVGEGVLFFPPPLWGRVRVGGRAPCLHCTASHPSPPPQGGREFCPLALSRKQWR